jgi:putative membrane protein
VSDINENMAFTRTHLAAERTLMAWVRTAFSMISFGFTIGKFFQYLNEHEVPGHRMGEGRMLAVGLIVLGLVSMLAGIWEYRRTLHQLESLTTQRLAAPLSITTIAVLVALLGVIAFVGLFTHLGRG